MKRIFFSYFLTAIIITGLILNLGSIITNSLGFVFVDFLINIGILASLYFEK